ncbi:hypothetical protein HMN09_01093600 [Mycena chlorophos]|uniref:DUF6924 domain-containing protein n=1 Tax=Mycena chlorophos TaxID=658473 RepID=A0A8H6SE83_MYCCL|nr:hypothetical protein HMN09_01093600 [Mycena chlorophos]
MANWVVFLTASNVDAKALTRAFLAMHDFEFNEYPPSWGFVLTTSKTLPASKPPPTTLPITTLQASEYENLSLSEINAFVRSHEQALSAADLSHEQWVVLDQAGLEGGTCVVFDHWLRDEDDDDDDDDDDEDEDEGAGGGNDRFRACRVPWKQAHSMLSNLDIANMDFEDFVDEDAGAEADGTWKFTMDEEESTKVGEKRKKVEDELRAGGYIE